MKKKILFFLLFVICLFLNSCSEKDTTEPLEQCDPVEPTLEFDSFEQFIECLRSEGEVVNEEYSSIDIEKYLVLNEMIERGKIPTIVDENGENVILYDPWYLIGINGSSAEDSQHMSVSYNGKIFDEKVYILIRYLTEEELQISDNLTIQEIFEYRGRGLLRDIDHISEIIEGTMQLADREVEVILYDLIGMDSFVYFVYDDLEVYIRKPKNKITEEFLSQITVGYIEIE